MKKLFAFILTLMRMISLAACGGESPSESSTHVPPALVFEFSV